ncbi:MAG: phosphoribosyltransferase family protein [Clostridia bacterium]|nr:phosphoribosyltransferase family protein [Clostridia bacterium]
MKLIELIQKKISRYDDTHNFTCDNCGKEVFDGKRLCKNCKVELPYNNKTVCPFCGRRIKEEGVCLDCKKKPLETGKARSLWVHEGDAAKLVRLFKTGSKYLYRLFAEELTPLVLREFGDADALTFVPMTEKAVKKRGYNQTLLIAEALSESTGKELLRIAEKKRETADQRELTRERREENMKEAFKVTDCTAVKGRRILIVDDTLTTGATASALAAVLKKAGAEAVFLVVVTSVEKKNQFGIIEPYK